MASITQYLIWYCVGFAVILSCLHAKGQSLQTHLPNSTSTPVRTTTASAHPITRHPPIIDVSANSTLLPGNLQIVGNGKPALSTTTESDSEVISDRGSFTNSREKRPAPQKKKEAPSLNFTFSGRETKRNLTTVIIEPSRSKPITLVCNASYPIEWLSPQQAVWKSHPEIYEYRNHFPDVITHTIILKMKLPDYSELSSMEIYCSEVGDGFSSTRQIKKQSLLKIAKSSDLESIAISIVKTNISQSGIQQQFMAPLGRNEDCFYQFKFIGINKRFECYSNHHTLLSIKFDECFDRTICERRFSPERNCEFARDYTASKANRSADDLLSSSDEASAGIVVCKMSSGNDSESQKFVAKPYVHSLPNLCPMEDKKERRKIYIADNSLDDNVLRDGFISFCEKQTETQVTSRALATDPFDAWQTKEANYVGDNITVICTASFYHFAYGMRIWQSSNKEIVGKLHEQPHLKEPDPTGWIRGNGYFNFTLTINLKSAEVNQIICENYKKQSKGKIWKGMKISVRMPRNITFVDGTTMETVHIYNGEPIVLKCVADGDPVPKITWKNGRRDISPLIKVAESNQGKTSTITFPSSKDHDNLKVSELHGSYTCRATNKISDIEEKHFQVQASNGTGTVPPPNEKSEGGGTPWYVWVIVVPILVIIVGGIIGFLVWKINKQSQELRLLSKAEVDEFIFGKPEFLQHHSSTEEVNNYAPYLPYNRGYEIAKEQLEIDPSVVLGSGAYAVVLRGTVDFLNGDMTKVAIKTGKPMDDVSYFKALLSELKIMGFIGTHPNIVNLVGAYTKNIQNREIYIAIEFCENGNILSFLRDNRHRFTNQVDGVGEFIQDTEITRDSFVYPGKEGLTTVTLIKWAAEVATGMEFLAQKKVIHGDLAARNILLTEHLVAKIGDFGLSRQLFEYANYIKKQQSPLPWKWLAIECLQDMRFSVKSDVWAYSILLFEIFTLGQVPYPGHSYNDDFLEALVNGKRPNKPTYATKEVFELMSSGWKEKPEDRPNFTQIKEILTKMITHLVPQEYLDLHEKVTSVIFPPRGGSGDQNPSASPLSPHDYSTSSTGNMDEKQFRFSFNKKTVTALFHRN